MSRNAWIKGLLVAVFAALSFSAIVSCGMSGEPPNSLEGGHSSTSSTAGAPTPLDHGDEDDGDLCVFDWGSFVLIDSWDRYDPQSTESKPFFVPEDYDGVGVPDNISVEHGTSRYPKDDAGEFGEAIMAQLLRQADGSLSGNVSASGTVSNKGETVLVFSFSVGDRQITQYYICGDREYILVYETNFTGSPECDEAAKTIVNTFEWPEYGR